MGRAGTARASPSIIALFAGAAVVALYWLQIRATNAVVTRVGIHMPYAFWTKHYVEFMLFAAILQTLLLYVVYRCCAARAPAPKMPLLTLATALAVISLAAIPPEQDVYAYIGFAKLPTIWAAYAHPPYHARAGFEIINRYWRGLPPSVYGPLWVAVNRLLVLPAHSVALALLSLRIFALALWCMVIESLRRLGVGWRVLAVLALNPFFYFYFVVEAHNDLWAVTLVLVGMVLSQRRPILGAAVAAAGGLVKITLTLLAALLLDRRSCSLGHMLLQIGVIALVVAVPSFVFGGPHYFAAMTHRTKDLSVASSALHPILVSSHFVMGVAVIICVALASLTKVIIPAASFGFPALSVTVYPWYLAWALPYALRAGNEFLAYFCIILPAAGLLADPQYAVFPSHPWTESDFLVLAVLVAVVAQAFGSVSRLPRQAV